MGTGIHLVEASYAGARSQAASVSNTVALTAQPAKTQVQLNALPASGTYGQPVTLSALLAPDMAQDHTASGTVTFYNGAASLGTVTLSSSGVANLTTSTLPVGTDCLTARYGGDINFTTSTSGILCYGVTSFGAQTITFPPPPAPAYAGTSVLLAATASSGLPVTYTVVSGPAYISTLNGAVLTYTGAGTVVVQADQLGNAAYSAAAAVQDSVTVTVLTSPVGTPVPVTTTVVFTVAGALGAPFFETQGALDLDFRIAPGGTCSVGHTYAVGDACSVSMLFNPTAPGLRLGGVDLVEQASAGILLGASDLYGMGMGPEVTWSPGTQSTLVSGYYEPFVVALEGSGTIRNQDNAPTSGSIRR